MQDSSSSAVRMDSDSSNKNKNKKKDARKGEKSSQQQVHLKEWKPRRDLRTLEKRIGYKFPKPALLKKALTPHAANRADTYQVLEFFGDGALRYAIPHILKARYPKAEQGELSRMYSFVTCNTNLALMSYRLRVPYYLRFNSRPSINRKLLADVVEAIIGAVDECGGVKAVTQVCQKIFKLDIELARFHEPQDTLLRILRHPSALDSIRKHAAPNSPLKNIDRNPRVSYQVHVIQKKWGKLGHVCVLRINGVIVVTNGEGYDAESANNNAAAIALLKLFPHRFPSKLHKFSWRI